MALARARPELVQRFFYLPERARDFGFLCSVLAGTRKAYRIVSPAELEKLSGTVHHQGVVAMIRNENPRRVDDVLIRAWAAEGRRVVVLDRVGDDHNLGSIARSAAFFGWSALVVGDDDGAARLSTSAYRVARGALSRIAVYSDVSAATFVKRCAGVLTTLGADHRAPTELRTYSSTLARNRNSESFAAKGLALVLGNEETGLSDPVRDACHSLVRIAGAGAIESLNVSQAAAVLLYELGLH